MYSKITLVIVHIDLPCTHTSRPDMQVYIKSDIESDMLYRTGYNGVNTTLSVGEMVNG